MIRSIILAIVAIVAFIYSFYLTAHNTSEYTVAALVTVGIVAVYFSGAFFEQHKEKKEFWSVVNYHPFNR